MGFICTAWCSHCPSLFFSGSFSSCSLSLWPLVNHTLHQLVEQLQSSKRKTDGAIGAGIEGPAWRHGTSNLSSITVITFLTLVPKGMQGSDLSDHP